MKCLEPTIYNLVLRQCGKSIFYFNSDGIFCRCNVDDKPNNVEAYCLDCYDSDMVLMTVYFNISKLVKFKYAFLQYSYICNIINNLQVGDTIDYFDNKILDYYDDYNVTMYYQLNARAKITDRNKLINTIVRIYHDKAFYFDSKYKYRYIPLQNNTMPIEKRLVYNKYKVAGDFDWLTLTCNVRTPPKMTIGRISRLKEIIGYLIPGDTIDFFEEIINMEYGQMRTAINNRGVNRIEDINVARDFIIKVSPPIIGRYYTNKNTKTFDFITIYMSFLDSPNYKEIIKNNFKSICKIALKRLKSYDRFQKYGIPVNYLKLSDFTILSDKRIELKFELKLKEESLS